jgi:thioester reductase-like protein
MGGYPQSKWVAEMLVQQMADKGFPITISRPATICASTETHKANWDDFTHRVLLAILTVRAFTLHVGQPEIAVFSYMNWFC